MKRIDQVKRLLLVLLCLIPLASCVDVEDFGDAWRKAGMDKRLAGSWKVVAASPEETRENGYSIGDVWRVDAKGGAYEVSFPGAESAPGGQPLYPIKTMSIGRCQFLLIGQTKGQLIRYKLQGRTLLICIPHLAKYVRRFYPGAAVIQNDADEDVTTILRFDQSVLDLIAQVPDGEDYWICDFIRFQRVGP
jgi:hypothetical protein